MKHFIDRIEELATLEQQYALSHSALVVLYGRRRVGKTALLSEFIKDKHAIYYLVTEESESQNRIAFKNMAADFIGSTLLKKADVEDWETIFEAIVAAPSPQKKILVIDEFQYLGKSNAAFPSIFQRIWDTQLQQANVMVVLCGSLITMMESQALNYASPLYGRRTAQIKLRQIPFRYYREFYPNRTHRELVERYSVTGGVPKYIELFEDQPDILEAIQKNVLNRSGFLYEEPTFLLQYEVTEIGSYFSIIKAIAAGNQKPSKIATVLETPQTNLPKYFKTLIDLDILEREVPVTEASPEKSKRGLYKIKDYFLEFWFRFVYPNLSYVETGHEYVVLKKLQQNFIDNHVSFVYEDVCRQEVWQLSADGSWPFYFEKVGRWWDNHSNEIDIVAIDSEGNNILFGECKFWEQPAGLNVLQELESKADHVDWHKNDRQEWFVLFSISGFSEELQAYADTHPRILLMS